jgi:hypothetical protein
MEPPGFLTIHLFSKQTTSEIIPQPIFLNIIRLQDTLGHQVEERHAYEREDCAHLGGAAARILP